MKLIANATTVLMALLFNMCVLSAETRPSAHVQEEPSKIDKEKVRNYILNNNEIVLFNPHKNAVAVVEHNTEISREERAYLSYRQEHVKIGLERLLRRPFDRQYIPRISLVLGGGGERALWAVLTVLDRMEQVGFLDVVTYIASSGAATWPVGAWMSGIMQSRSDFWYYFPRYIADLFVPMTPTEAALAVDSLSAYCAYGQLMSGVNIMGLALSNRLFVRAAGARNKILLSEQARRLQSGKSPFPLYGASVFWQGKSGVFEFNPFEAGSVLLNAYVPMWSYGRTFNKGVSTNYAPEQPLGTILATCGASFIDTAVLKNVRQQLSNRIQYQNIDSLLHPNGVDRLLDINSVDVPSFVASDSSRLSVESLQYDPHSFMTIQNNYNLPCELVSPIRKGRTSNIIIICDASYDYTASLLTEAEHQASVNNVLFPPIDRHKIGTAAAVVFEDERDPAVPVVIHISAPFTVDSGFAGLTYQTMHQKPTPIIPMRAFDKKKMEDTVRDFSAQLDIALPLIYEVINKVTQDKGYQPWNVQ
jgi:Lysophospholipase catalytic domain